MKNVSKAAEFNGLDSSDDDAEEYQNSRICKYSQEHSPEVDFLWSLAIGEPESWICQEHRKVDLSESDHQKETWTFEISWTTLHEIAKAHGLTLTPGSFIPLPILGFRRFVPTKYECTSHPEAYMTHRHTNDRFATLMTIRAIFGKTPDLSDPLLQQCYENACAAFNYGCSLSEEALDSSVARQRKDIADLWKTYKQCLTEHNSENVSPIELDHFVSATKIIDSYTKEYPVLLYTKVKESGHEIFTIRVERHAPAWKRSRMLRYVKEDWEDDQTDIKAKWKNEEEQEKYLPFYRHRFWARYLFTLCRFRQVGLRRQWLRQSSFLEVVFPRDCRPALIFDRGLINQRSLFSGNTLFSPMSIRSEGKKNESDSATPATAGKKTLEDNPETHTHDRLIAVVIPRLRVVAPILVFFAVEFMLLIGFCFILLNNECTETAVPIFGNAILAQFILTWLIADRKESSMATSILITPRVLVPVQAVIVNAVMLFLSIGKRCNSSNWQSAQISIGQITITWASIAWTIFVIGALLWLVLGIWLGVYLYVRHDTYIHSPEKSEKMWDISGVRSYKDSYDQIFSSHPNDNSAVRGALDVHRDDE
ncbi:hypothetical protein OZX72_09375 [Bifidobacterium sp. ESL0769]|uniref:hypothetical protein n=1 Tax=Bifidobacterium sp. ESL0769 TaxID=2983229 RepID=UPI0023F8A679|nr:hypothetical protein [Bifidobacterium sp. ESL0769]WEV67421.1 hypothetical protein OZX72_09375 [Bifidobacterium sp. ESL0769]